MLKKISTSLCTLFLSFAFVGCSFLEDHLASMIEPNVVPSTIADVFSGVSQNIAAAFTELSHLCEEGQGLNCNEGHKTLSLNDCSIQEPFALNGLVNFEFNKDECLISDPGDYIQRHFDAQLSGYSAFYINIRPDSYFTYNDERVPLTEDLGVQRLTFEGSEGMDSYWSYNSTGLHRRGGLDVGVVSVKPLNHSVLTTEDFYFVGDDLTSFSSTPDEGGRHRGKIKFYNNQAEYHGTLSQDQENPLVFESCSCPTRGALEGTFNGSSEVWGEYSEAQKTMRIEFAGCGLADFTFKGKTHESVQLDSCFGL